MYYVYFPDEHFFEAFESRDRAESYAQEYADEGIYCELLEVMRTFEAKHIDLCKYNGVEPGIDCPAFV